MVSVTQRDLCRLALLSLKVVIDGRSYTPLLGQTLRAEGR